MAAAGFLSRYLNGSLPYNRKYNVLSASLNKTFPTFDTSYINGYFISGVMTVKDYSRNERRAVGQGVVGWGGGGGR